MERGRPSKYDAEFVRDIAVQVLYAFYNERQSTLREHIMRDPDYVSKMRGKAHFMDVTVRTWLDVLDYVPHDHPSYVRELMFRQWCLRLEPPMPPQVLARDEPREKLLRALIEKHLTDEYWRVNCKRWIDAIRRVREDKCVTLKIPPTIDPSIEEDEYL